MDYFLHTADIHIKVPARNKTEERKWYLDRFYSLIGKLSKISTENNIVATFITGDVFDKMPTPEDVALLSLLLFALPKPIYITEGNHDRKNKHQFLYEIGQMLPPMCAFVGMNEPETRLIQGLDCTFVSNDWVRKGKKIPANKGILFSHIAHEFNIGSKSKEAEYDLTSLDSYDLVLLGDIHTAWKYSDKIYYSGSPYRTHKKSITSLDEIDNSVYGVNLIEVDTLIVHKKELMLPNHYIWKQEEYQPIPPSLLDFIDIELTTTLEEAKAHVNKDLTIKIEETETSFEVIDSFSKSIKTWWESKYSADSENLYNLLIEVCPWIREED